MTYSSEFPSNLLSLDRYCNLIGIDPIRFFQGQTALRNGTSCSDIFYQFAWQGDQRISREELRQAISQAESDLIKAVGYFPAPQWHSETVDYPQFYQKEYRGTSGYQSNGFVNKSVNTTYGKLISGGVRATTKIDSANVTRNSDIDTTGDSFNDTAVFTVTDIDFSICELQSFVKEYSALDAANTRTDPGSSGADNYWRVRESSKTLSGTTATVYIPVYLLFKPQLQRQINADVIDADDSNSYVDTIEFYRVYNDTSSQATLLWVTESSCSDVGCAYTTQAACLRRVNNRSGMFAVSPGTYSATTGQFSQTCFTQNREPDKVIINYYSGSVDQNTRNCDNLSYFWAMNIAILATSRLRKSICSCENVLRQVEKWQEDLALTNDVRSYSINFDDLSNPFGTTYGSVLVWNRIKNRGLKLGKRIMTY